MKEDIRNAFLLIVLEFNHEGICFCYVLFLLLIDNWILYLDIFHILRAKNAKKIAWYTSNFKIVNYFYFDYESSTNR